jgi:tRNA dimethylallyltransferase
MIRRSLESMDKMPGADSDKGHNPAFTLIAGPTASGKSALAMRLAEERGAIIVNADSMQVYRELRVLTARPTLVDEARITHRLYGHRSARERYSVADWLGDIAPLVEEARAGGPPLAIVGGTGLYFRGLLEGLSPVPEIPDAIRERWRAEGLRLVPEALHAELASRDPDMAARLRPSDPHRIIRAIEVFEATGRSLADWQKVAGAPLIREDEADRIYLAPPRDEIYARVNSRLEGMIEEGALDEVRALMALDLPPDRPALRAHGVPSFSAYLRGELSFSAAMERAQTDTRNYVKRQLTWARRNMMSWEWLVAQ